MQQTNMVFLQLTTTTILTNYYTTSIIDWAIMIISILIWLKQHMMSLKIQQDHSDTLQIQIPINSLIGEYKEPKMIKDIPSMKERSFISICLWINSFRFLMKINSLEALQSAIKNGKVYPKYCGCTLILGLMKPQRPINFAC